MMYWITGADHQEYGPVDRETICAWIRSGRVNGRTLARSETMEHWDALHRFSEFAHLLWGIPLFSDYIIQRRRPVGQSALLLKGQINLERFQALDCLSEAWGAMRPRISMVVGCSLLILLMGSVMSQVGQLPLVGFLLKLGVDGILQGCFFGLALKVVKAGQGGDEVEIQDAFLALSRSSLHVVLASVTMLILTGASLLVVTGPFLYPFFQQLLFKPVGVAFVFPVMSLFRMCVGFTLGAVILIGFYTLWMYAYLLILDRKMVFWRAMETSRKWVMQSWSKHLTLSLTSALIMLSGILACLVGILITLPLGYIMVATAYEKWVRHDDQNSI